MSVANQLAPLAYHPVPEAMARVATIAKGYDVHFVPFEPPSRWL
jgi:hypothetical protein